jgi:hypothetical protein
MGAGAMTPRCGFCEESSAVCVGAYEGEERLRFACGECCGHGCEDGQCYPLAEDWPTDLDHLRARVAELEVFCRKLYPHTFAGGHPGLGRAAELRAEMFRLGLEKADE